MSDSRTSAILNYVRRKLIALLRRKLKHDEHALNIAAFSRDNIGAEIFEDGLYERNTLLKLVPAIEAISGKEAATHVCVDVGANIGNHSVFLSPHFLRVYAFEPNPISASILRANLLMNSCANVEPFQFGLGDRGTVQKQFVPPGNLGGSSFVHRPDTVAHQFDLVVRNGDEVVSEIGIDPESLLFIKIDVEGFEIEVLKGLANTIRRGKPVIGLEVKGFDDGAQPPATVSLLKDLGYCNFFEISRGSASDRLALRFLHLLFTGGEFRPRRIESFERRDYTMVLAAP